MVSIYQRLLIILILTIAFAGKLTVYAFTIQKPFQEILKEKNSKQDKTAGNENNGQEEEKLKLDDLAINRLIQFDFLDITNGKTSLFTSDYMLVSCFLQTLEYPPK